MSHAFCRLLLAEARREAKRQRVQLPKRMGTTRSQCGPNPYFYVWGDRPNSTPGKPDNGPLWEGEADCSYHARAQAIQSWIDAIA